MSYIDNTIQGWMGPEELQWLFQQAQQMETIVEIGAWRGKSTHALLSGCPGTVYVVDHWFGTPSERCSAHKDAATQDIFKQFMKNVGHFPNLRVLRGNSVEVAATFADKSIDMCFIDGDHSYEAVSADIKAWLPKTKKLICGHDIVNTDVNQAVIENFPEFKCGPWRIWYELLSAPI